MDEGLNVGVLLFLPYRAMENRVFEALAVAGFAALRRRDLVLPA